MNDKLNKTMEIKVKTISVLQKGIGKETSDVDEMADDAVSIYNNIIQHLPAEKQNIKSVFVKLTMGKPVRIE